MERLTEGQMLERFGRSIRALQILGEERRRAKRVDRRGKIIDLIGTDPSGLAFAMTMVHGGTLDEVTRNPWPLAKKIQFMTEVVVVVSYSHDNGVIHRDIKPANILLDTQLSPVLTDFGAEPPAASFLP